MNIGEAESPIILASDNWAGAAPEIIHAIVRGNAGAVPAYGGDGLTERVSARFCEIFETDCAAYLMATGTAANGLALAAIAPPYGTILCHEAAHIQLEEAGAVEFFTGGGKLLPIHAPLGKLTPEILQDALAGWPRRPPHTLAASALSCTQATECGTVYSVSELTALCDAAHAAGLAVHMDGARFANAVAANGASPAELSWKSGVDVLSFGGTKNGCLAAEAVIFFDRSKVGSFELRRKRGGHLWSKMRFISAQFLAYLENGLWLRLASQANAMAAKLSAGLAGIDGVEICYPTEINEIFVIFPDGVAEELRRAGVLFYPWVAPGTPASRKTQRLVTSFQTSLQDIERFLALVQNTMQRD